MSLMFDPEAFAQRQLASLTPTETQMLLSYQRVSGSWSYERVEGASHWMQLDRADQVTHLVLQFLTASAGKKTL